MQYMQSLPFELVDRLFSRCSMNTNYGSSTGGPGTLGGPQSYYRESAKKVYMVVEYYPKIASFLAKTFGVREKRETQGQVF